MQTALTPPDVFMMKLEGDGQCPEQHLYYQHCWIRGGADCFWSYYHFSNLDQNILEVYKLPHLALLQLSRPFYSRLSTLIRLNLILVSSSSLRPSVY